MAELGERMGLNTGGDLRALTRNPWLQVIACVLLLPFPATAFQEEFPPTTGPAPQVEIQGWVNVEALNLRSGPGTNHRVIQVLPANQPVRLLEESGPWIKAGPSHAKKALICREG